MYSMVTPQPRWRPFSNPAPLGNSGFAVSTFVSALHTGAIGIASGAPPNIVVGLALFYGGMAQILAGTWSFASNNNFGAIVFTSYGCYWMSYAATLIPGFGISDMLDSLSPEIRAQSLGIFYLVWVIQTFIFVLGSSRSNWGTFVLLVFLLITNILTCIGKWTQGDSVLRASGYMGLFTAIVAWYNVAVDMLNSNTFYFSLPNPSIGPHTLEAPMDPAVHTPYFHDHHSHHHGHPHVMSKLEGRTPGNHFDFVTTLPQTTAVGGTANINVVSGGRNRSDSVQSAGFGGSHGRSIGFDTANLQTFLPNMRSNISDATKAGVEITSVEGSVDHQRSDNDDEIVAHMA